MTIGEKIQYYRKQNGFSQEELAQKLLVSRQTVSLWEMDKTLPTIDNLVRLKEIFNVSFDNMLDESNPDELNKSIPKETYTYTYSKEDVRAISKKLVSPLIRNLIVALSILVVAFFWSFLNDSVEMAIVVILVAVILTILFARQYFTIRKARKESEERVSKSSYHYEFFDTHFNVRIDHEGDEVPKLFTFNFTDIEHAYDYDECFVLEIMGRAYIIRKSSLCIDSVLLIFLKSNPNKIRSKPQKSRLEIISLFLFAGSILSLVCAMASVGFLSSINNYFLTENMWVFFLFTPIPIASIVIGVISKQKGYKYKKNLIAGIICTVLLCIYGLFYFLFAGKYNHSEEPIYETEKMLSIDIPEHRSIINTDRSKDWQDITLGYVYTTSEIFFDSEEGAALEKIIKADNRWLVSYPTHLSDVLYSIDAGCEYFMLYSEDTNEVNELPKSNGIYSFIALYYDKDAYVLYRVEYSIEYMK